VEDVDKAGFLKLYNHFELITRVLYCILRNRHR